MSSLSCKKRQSAPTPPSQVNPSPSQEQEGVAIDMADETRIAEALTRLLKRDSNVEDAFVIIEGDSDSEFVQFLGSTTEPLMLDFPTMSLTEDEKARAKNLFSDIPNSSESEYGFQVLFDQDTASAALLVIRVFREVYQSDGSTPLTIREQ